MKKALILILALVVTFASCRGTRDPFPAAVKHGGPCPQNKGYIGYSNY